MKRYGSLFLLASLAACGGTNGMHGSTPAAPEIPAVARHAATASASASCSVNGYATGYDTEFQGTGTTTTDSWGIYYSNYVSLDHRDSTTGNIIAQYTVPSDPYSAQWLRIDQLAMVGTTPWITGSYANSQGNVTHYIARFNGSGLTTYPYGAYSIGAIAGSAGGPVYFAATDTTGHLVLERFNGSGVSVVAKAPYSGMQVNSMVAFGTSAVVLLTQGTQPHQNAVAAHWNGSTFSFHELRYNVGANGDPGVQITGLSPNDLWAVTSHNIYRYNAQWQPYAYVPAQYGSEQFGGVVELRSNYVIVTGSQGSNNTFAPLAYAWHGVNRFEPITITIPHSGLTGGLTLLTAVPGTTKFYGNFEAQSGPGFQTIYNFGLANCPG